MSDMAAAPFDGTVLIARSAGLLVAGLQAACELFRAETDAAAVSVAVLTEQRAALRYVAAAGAGASGIVGTTVPVEASIAGYAALSGQRVSVADVGQDPRFNRAAAEASGYVPRSLLVVPLVSADETAGVISLLDAAAPDAPALVSLLPTLLPTVQAVSLLGGFSIDPAARAMEVLAGALASAGAREARFLRDLVAALAAFTEA